MRRLFLCALFATALPLAAQGAERLRGTVTAMTADTLTMRTNDGGQQSIHLGADTKFATLTRASLSDVTTGAFIGTATRTAGDRQIAIEVVIFPEAMRGTGEGHYGWDSIADPTLKSASSSTMTNGTIASTSAGKSTNMMTNGDVKSAATQGGARTLVVTYKGGQQTILVPPTAPIVLAHQAGSTALAVGDKVFLVAVKNGATLDGKLVAIGTGGVTPPM